MNRRDPNRKQAQLIPELVRERIEKTPHAARFFLYITQILDLPFYEENHLGAPAYDRPTIVALILYSMYKGWHCAADICRFARDDLGAIWILGEIRLPSEKTMQRIIDEMLEHIEIIFGQVLSVCEILNLIGKERVFTDGSKKKANASKHKAMSYKRLCEEIDKFEEEIDVIVEELTATIDGLCELTDEELKNLILEEASEIYRETKRKKEYELRQKELEVFGGEDEPKEPVSFHSKIVCIFDEEDRQRIKETMDELGFKTERLDNMEESRAILKEQWKEENGDKPIPDEKQINFTDPESSIMFTKHNGVQQCYNEFILVDDLGHIIVGAHTTNTSSDMNAFVPTCMHAQKFTDLEGMIIGADAGFFSADNMGFCQNQGIDLYVSAPEPKGEYHKVNFTYDDEQDAYICPEGELLTPSERVSEKAKTVSYKTEACKSCSCQKKCTKANDGMRKIQRHRKKAPLLEEARKKASSPEGQVILSMRKGVVEPVWGNLLMRDGLEQHHYRGLDKASREFKLRCVVHNLRKIFKAFANDEASRSQIKELAEPAQVA